MERKALALDFGREIENQQLAFLLHHLEMERQISKEKDDLYGYLWATYPLILIGRISGVELRESVKKIKEEIKQLDFEENILTTELVTAFALGIAVILSMDKKVPKGLRSIMKKLLVTCKISNWLDSTELCSVLLFCLNNIECFNDECREIALWLEPKLEEASRQNNHPRIIDIAFGLSHLQPEVSVPSVVLDEAEKQSLEKIAKLCYLSYVKGCSQKEDIFRLLEYRIREKFENWIPPGLEFSIFEGINLANSTLSEKSIKGILKSLRKSDTKWAEKIDITGDNLILTGVGELPRLPNLNVKEDALAAVALLKTGTERVYQLKPGEYRQATNAIRVGKKDFIGVKDNQLKAFFYISFGLLAVFMFSSLWALGLLDDAWLVISGLISKDVSLIIQGSFSSIVIFIAIYVLVVYYRVYIALINKGIIYKNEIYKLLPIITWVINKARGEQ